MEMDKRLLKIQLELKHIRQNLSQVCDIKRELHDIKRLIAIWLSTKGIFSEKHKDTHDGKYNYIVNSSDEDFVLRSR